ncbi:ankyrin repeat domain-containing protein 2b [Senna tora]|uniref:Ankyrin repeat domain-containing protein 2b n=1 Tax=Senna tora TaxID=362788 RepID=A0A834WV44_9FABA|nr:ankyrin repeat domain-containing protein 2b [Senna tora]
MNCWKLVGYIIGETKPPAIIEAFYAQWDSENSLVVSWLINTMQFHISKQYLLLDTAEKIWTSAKRSYSSKGNDAQIYEIKTKIHGLKQEELTVNEYYSELSALWKELDYYQDVQVKYSEDILGNSPFSSVEDAFSIVLQEESRCGVMLYQAPIEKFGLTVSLEQAKNSPSDKNHLKCDYCGMAFKAHLPTWMIDSCANRHMTGSSKNLSNYSPCSRGENVRIANGSSSLISRIDSLLCTPDITLSSVLHVLEFLDLHTGKKIGSGRLHDGLYVIDSARDSGQVFFGVNKGVYQEIIQWHRRETDVQGETHVLKGIAESLERLDQPGLKTYSRKNQDDKPEDPTCNLWNLLNLLPLVNYLADCSLEIFDDPSAVALLEVIACLVMLTVFILAGLGELDCEEVCVTNLDGKDGTCEGGIGYKAILLEVGLLYAQREPSFMRPISRGIQRCLVRWLVQQRMELNFHNLIRFLWHRIIRGRSYRHLMLQIGYNLHGLMLPNYAKGNLGIVKFDKGQRYLISSYLVQCKSSAAALTVVFNFSNAGCSVFGAKFS